VWNVYGERITTRECTVDCIVDTKDKSRSRYQRTHKRKSCRIVACTHAMDFSV